MINLHHVGRQIEERLKGEPSTQLHLVDKNEDPEAASLELSLITTQQITLMFLTKMLRQLFPGFDIFLGCKRDDDLHEQTANVALRAGCNLFWFTITNSDTELEIRFLVPKKDHTSFATHVDVTMTQRDLSAEAA